MSAFFVPAWDDVDEEGGSVCEAGRQDCTITKIKAEESRTGRDMMVCEYTVDNGKSAGQTLTEYFVFGLNKQVGEAKLKRMLKASGFKSWRQAPTLKEFVAQFPENRLRVSVLVDHQYSVKRDDDSWDNVPKSVFDSYEGKKNIRAVVSDDWENDYRPAENPPALTLAPNQIDVGGQVVTDDSANLPFDEDFKSKEKAPF